MNDPANVQQLLGLRRPPIAIAFASETPAAIPHWAGPAQPAGCAFWEKAQAGEVFYTLPEDHYGCAVGAYTHAIDLPPERGSQLQDTLGVMVESGYLEMAEVPGIPRLARPPVATLYGPADDEAFAPDLVMIAASPAQAMLIYEACLRAAAGNPLTNLMGRPSCAVLPLTLAGGAAAMSLACAGNRLYTGLGEDELYVSVPGSKWGAFKAALQQITAANQSMREVYAANEHYRAPQGS
jgi:uncharacterized protein (DUF169 family)